MKRFVTITFVIILFVILTVQSVHAIGALFTRPLGRDTEYQKMWIKKVDSRTDVDGQIAVTYVDQVFHNEMNQTVEGVWVFPLPEGAVVTELYYWFNGVRYKGAIRERQEAREQYQRRIRQLLDPALLEYLGDNLYRLSIAPINANSDVRTEITYVQMLPYEFGTVDFDFKLNAVGVSPKPLERVSFQGTFQSSRPYTSFSVPSHEGTTALDVTKVNDKKYNVVYGDENFLPDRDLNIQFETDRDEVDVNVIRYTPTPEDSIGDDSYYAVWITPPDQIGEEEVIPKKIVFTADVSSSMEGMRIEQLKTALQTFLNHLQPEDKFNIVTFGTSVTTFENDVVDASTDNIDRARDFVTNIGALGLTAINDALLASLQQNFSDGYANMIVFITDGYPTWGETFVPDIVKNFNDNNTKDVRLFSFGVGDDVSKTLLTQLAVENGGYAKFIERNEDISTVVGNHFKRISKPVLTDLDIKIEGLTTAEKFPRPLPDLFWGSQVMQLGIYKNSGTFPVYLTGYIRDKEVSFVSHEDFPTVPGGHRFVPRLWAKAKIDYLLEQIDIYGEKDELVNQVIELSLKFQILTPYTAFYADPNEPGTIVDEKQDQVPEGFALHQNHPNPFNPSTTIAYELPEPGFVTIKIYDLSGRLVRILVSEQKNAGMYRVLWDGTSASGAQVAAGVYFYRIEFTGTAGKTMTLTKKMSLVR